jgi:hypothetical protein
MENTAGSNFNSMRENDKPKSLPENNEFLLKKVSLNCNGIQHFETS